MIGRASLRLQYVIMLPNVIRANYLPIYQPQSLPSWFRHLAFPQHGGKYLVSRIFYYANSNSTFHQPLLITSGDVSPNLGPKTKSSWCSACMKIVPRNHRALNCNHCGFWCHMKCGQVKLNEYKHCQQEGQFNWICPACLTSVLPFAKVSILMDEDNQVELVNKPFSAEQECEETDSFYLAHLSEEIRSDEGLLKVAHININGLLTKAKLQQIQLLETTKLDLLEIADSKLTSETKIGRFKYLDKNL